MLEKLRAARPEQPDTTHAETRAAPAKASWRATRLGDHELLKRLGEGGMGTVYQARHSRLKRVVALKVLPKDRLNNKEAVRRFEREMEAVGRLVHRDVKPSNFMLDTQGRVKLLDLGLAQCQEAESLGGQITGVGQVMGTPEFPSPESRSFDPYHRWLGIPPAEQPATHYPLLGLTPFESDREVIRGAAARQMAHVRSYHLGQHAERAAKGLPCDVRPMPAQAIHSVHVAGG